MTVPAFFFLPGFALFCLFSVRRSIPYNFGVILIVSTSLSFSFNFMMNILAYLIEPNIRTLATISLCCASALYLVCIFARKKLRSEPIEAVSLWKGVTVLSLIPWIISGIVFFIFCLHVPTSYMEETYLLRQIVSSEQIKIDNLGFLPGEIPTYIFIPFYLVITMISQVMHCDLLVAHAMLWGFTASLSLICLCQLAYIISASRIAPAILSLIGLLTVFTFSACRSDLFSALFAQPDRYGFAISVLFPLALLHFIIHMRDNKTNIAMFIGLTYLVIEMSFVHAREALYALGGIALFILLMVASRQGDKRALKRAVTILFLCVVVLGAYKFIVLRINIMLGSYIQSMSRGGA